MFGGGAKSPKKPSPAEQVANLEGELGTVRKELVTLKARLEEAEQKRQDAEQQVQEKERAAADLKEKTQKLAQELETSKAAAGEDGAKMAELQEVQERYQEAERALSEAKEAKQGLESRLHENEQVVEALRTQCDMLQAKGGVSHHFLDVEVCECEFASAYAFSVQVQIKGRAERRSSEVSLPSQAPVFEGSAFLLPTDGDVTDDALKVSAFVHVADPSTASSETVGRLLGEAEVSLAQLLVPEGSQASRRVTRTISFTRFPASGIEGSGQTMDGAQLTVGRATIRMQVKVMTPLDLEATKKLQVESSAPLPATFPSLDRSLWVARPFQSRVRALVHRATDLPAAPPGAGTTARASLRLLRPDGQVLHESSTLDVPLKGDGRAELQVEFGQELVVPVPFSESKELRLQLTLEMVSGGTGGMTTASVLSMQWHPESLPPLVPLHLHAVPSEPSSGAASSVARPRPTLLVSLVHEPAHEALDTLGGGESHGTELRVHSVPVGRSLPSPVTSALVAVCPNPADSYGGAGGRPPQIPVATYYYDQRMDLATFLQSQLRSTTQGPQYFLTPLSGHGRSPSWGQFGLRCLANRSALSSISLLLFDIGADPGAPLRGELLGFATVDAAVLASREEPLQRSFMADLRLLEAPGASTSLEVEVRVWPRGGVRGAPSVGMGTAPASIFNEEISAIPALAASLQQESSELRLNHELSVQLAKEFNLRAAALKKAGEEIVTLRRQVQLLRNENGRLKAQVEEEERTVAEVHRRGQLPHGLESLSSSELASKLARCLERYREEKGKSAELNRRLEEVLREVQKGRSLERALEELEHAHLEQNRELQRLQEEGKQVDKYRQNARAQEKVITKLEKTLEGSLHEVQKAHRLQVDVEKMKTENLRLREKCSQLVTRRQQAAGTTEDAEDLQRKVAEKNDEVARLQTLVRDLQRGLGRSQQAPDAQWQALPSSEMAREQQKLDEAEERRFEWEQRCQAAEQRLQMLQQQLSESSRKYGGERATLQTEVAKRDARILELEFLLREQEERGPSG